ncbi:hypothetical protein BC937DRAFT_93138 [Endogone sp. FLAS-F59071]|nr:hypothetical protein BC937DRAFT_93138 [Endogone sp. FLAS-F59071]|eukprot:RUS14939.1 hypothetical protein BC937DRAFT_93138 [Endogone sp. FLAS-F59071]
MDLYEHEVGFTPAGIRTKYLILYGFVANAHWSRSKRRRAVAPPLQSDPRSGVRSQQAPVVSLPRALDHSSVPSVPSHITYPINLGLKGNYVFSDTPRRAPAP